MRWMDADDGVACTLCEGGRQIYILFFVGRGREEKKLSSILKKKYKYKKTDAQHSREIYTIVKLDKIQRDCGGAPSDIEARGRSATTRFENAECKREKRRGGEKKKKKKTSFFFQPFFVSPVHPVHASPQFSFSQRKRSRLSRLSLSRLSLSRLSLSRLSLSLVSLPRLSLSRLTMNVNCARSS